MNNIWDIFDHIYCIHFLSYKERRKNIENELKRIGILDNKHFSWRYTFDNPYKERIYGAITQYHTLNSADCAFNHYMCIKEAYLLGYNNVFIMEDDIAFLKDVDLIYKIIKHIPEKYDIIEFDYVLSDINYLNPIYKINEYYSWGEGLLASCYSLSRDGMKMVIDNFEKSFNFIDYYLSFFNHYDYNEKIYKIAENTKNLRHIISTPRLCCQQNYIDSENNYNNNKKENDYIYNSNMFADTSFDPNLYNILI